MQIPRLPVSGENLKKYLLDTIRGIIEYLKATRLVEGDGISIRETPSGVVVSAIRRGTTSQGASGAAEYDPGIGITITGGTPGVPEKINANITGGTDISVTGGTNGNPLVISYTGGGGGGGGGATGIGSTVSGGTASVYLDGGTGSVVFRGENGVAISGGSYGEIVISGGTGGGGGGEGDFEGYTTQIEASYLTVPVAATEYIDASVDTHYIFSFEDFITVGSSEYYNCYWNSNGKFKTPFGADSGVIYNYYSSGQGYGRELKLPSPDTGGVIEVDTFVDLGNIIVSSTSTICNEDGTINSDWTDYGLVYISSSSRVLFIAHPSEHAWYMKISY